MRKVIISFLLFLLVIGSGNANTVLAVSFRVNYAKRLSAIIMALSQNQEISIKDVEYAIPTSDDEFSIFYSYAIEETQKSFYILDKKMRTFANERKGNIFIQYLNLGAYVDGEFAESFFDYTEKIVAENKVYYCKVKHKIDKRARIRMFEHCKLYGIQDCNVCGER